MDDRGDSKEVQFLPCENLHKQTLSPGSGERRLPRLCPSDKDPSCFCGGGCSAPSVAHADGQSCFKETEKGKRSDAVGVTQAAGMLGTYSDAGFLGLADKQQLLSSTWAQAQLHPALRSKASSHPGELGSSPGGTSWLWAGGS